METTNLSSGAHEGTMKVKTKNERGMVVTNEYGFTVQEENGKVLAFDLIEHPDLGTTLLFGNQVFALKFWDAEDLDKGLKIMKRAVAEEYRRRENIRQRDYDATQ